MKLTPIQAASLILREYQRAAPLHPPMHSAHEGYAVILEELDEVWEEIKANNIPRSREEMIQVGAMALRYLVDVGNEEG